jgi:hypothetical protein
VVEKRAMDGRRVTVTRVVKKDGLLVRQEVISRDYYRAFPGVVRVGTRAVERPAAVPGARAATLLLRSDPAPVSAPPPAPANPGQE